jgi:hypothetical protein
MNDAARSLESCRSFRLRQYSIEGAEWKRSRFPGNIEDQAVGKAERRLGAEQGYPGALVHKVVSGRRHFAARE